MKSFGKYQDAGRLERDYDAIESKPSKAKKTKTVHQRIKVDAKNFPYLHKESIGDECEILVKVKKVSEAVPEEYEVDKDNSISLEIMSIAEPKEKNEYKEIMEDEEKNLKMHGK